MAPPKTSAQVGPPIQVLVIDDEAAHAEAVADSLKVQGYACTVATSGDQAIELMHHRAFEIIVTDLKMPRVGGMEVLSKAKELLPDAEVVLVTGHGTIESAVTAM